MHYFSELQSLLFQMVQVLYSIMYNNVHNFCLIIYFCTMMSFLVFKCILQLFMCTFSEQKVSCSIYLQCPTLYV